MAMEREEIGAEISIKIERRTARFPFLHSRDYFPRVKLRPRRAKSRNDELFEKIIRIAASNGITLLAWWNRNDWIQPSMTENI